MGCDGNSDLSPLVEGEMFGQNSDNSTDNNTGNNTGNSTGKNSCKAEWRVAEEVPLVIFYNSEQFGVMMLTPADFEDFAIGFSINEGIVSGLKDIKDVRLETVGDGKIVNIIVPEKALKIARSRKRTISGGSSCGICGAQTLAAALPKLKKTNGLVPEPEYALKALKALSSKQVYNNQNFSCHAAALANGKGEIILLREDVGRHNALDKLCGAMAQAGLGAREGFLVLSSRFSVEMAQKAIVTGFSFVAATSAPTALALSRAKQSATQVATLSQDALMIFK